MFTRFDEVGRRRERRRWVAVVSVGVHAALVWLVAVATGRADVRGVPVTDPDTIIRWAEARTAEPPPARATRPPVPDRGARAHPGEAVTTPRVPLPELPPIEVPVFGGSTPDAIATALTALASGARPAGDPSTAGPSGASPGGGVSGGVWSGSAVDVPVAPRPGNPRPRYPAPLERIGTTGRVTARFVVDTAGRVEPGSITIVASDHEQFAEAVRRALPRHRFVPARAGGAAVRQLVEMPFVFDIRR